MRAHFYGLREQLADCIVNITISRNEFAPQFDSPTYQASIMENFPLGDSILQVHATDQDRYVSIAVFLVSEIIKVHLPLGLHTGKCCT